MSVRVLFIGDIVGKPGRRVLKELLPKLKADLDIEFTIANGENSAGGAGTTEKVAKEIQEAGVDVLTGGNHTWDKREITRFIDDIPWVLRPLNYPPGAPGKGYSIFTSDTGVEITVINLMGRLFISNIDCPFRKIAEILENIHTKIIIVDFHAEMTSEKQAMGYFLDGKVSAVIGTHTHVQTADERVLPKGTAYITDVGMTGGLEGVIGIKRELVIEKLLHQLPVKYEPSNERLALEGVLLEIDKDTGKGTSIKRVRRYL